MALAILITAPALSGCGDDGTQLITKVEPLQLTAEQAARIQSEDDRVADEEGGARKVTKPTRKKRR